MFTIPAEPTGTGKGSIQSGHDYTLFFDNPNHPVCPAVYCELYAASPGSDFTDSCGVGVATPGTYEISETLELSVWNYSDDTKYLCIKCRNAGPADKTEYLITSEVFKVVVTTSPIVSCTSSSTLVMTPTNS